MNRPFDSAKYARLLEGLEATELQLAEVLHNNSKIRIDAAYFSKDALRVQALIEALSCGFTRLGETAAIFRKGIFDIKAESYTETGVPFVRISDLKHGLTDDMTIAYIPEEIHALEHKTALSFGDIVLSKTAYPAAAFVTFERCNVSQDTIAFKLASTWRATLRAGFVVAFLNSWHGKTLLWRQFQGNVQLHLSLPDAATIPIPLLSYEFQTQIESTLLTAFQELQKSREIYSQAENLLLTELGLVDWQPPQPQCYERRASTAFAAGRLDAEYFQPQYESLESFLRQKFTLERVENWARVLKGRSVEYVEDKAGIPVIRSGDLTDIDEEDKFLRSHSEQQLFFLKRGDILISSIGFGSIGKVQVFDKPGKYATVSEVTVIRQSRVNPYFLHFYLRSPAGQIQLNRYITGATGQLHLYPKDVGKLFVPIVAQHLEQELERFFIQTRLLKQQAAILLARATRAVEIAIEESEAAALAFLATA